MADETQEWAVRLLAPSGREQPVVLEVSAEGVAFRHAESGQVRTARRRCAARKGRAPTAGRHRAAPNSMRYTRRAARRPHAAASSPRASRPRAACPAGDPAHPLCVDRQVGAEQPAQPRRGCARLLGHPGGDDRGAPRPAHALRVARHGHGRRRAHPGHGAGAWGPPCTRHAARFDPWRGRWGWSAARHVRAACMGQRAARGPPHGSRTWRGGNRVCLRCAHAPCERSWVHQKSR